MNGGRGVNIVGQCGDGGVILKTGVWQIQRKSSYAVIPAQAGIQKFKITVISKHF